MDFSTILLLIITALTFLFFILEVFRPDLIALLVMTTLMLTGLVTPEEGLSGFSDPAVLTILAMLILSLGVQRTGLIYTLSKKLFLSLGSSLPLTLLFLTIFVAPLSAFISNTATVAILIPLLLSLSRQSKIPATKTLMPLSFLAQMGGMLTIIGTTVNILANNILAELGVQPLSMFELTPLALFVLFGGSLYLATLGHRLLPASSPETKTEPELHLFHTQVELTSSSPLIGLTPRQARKFFPEAKFLEIIRGEKYIKQISRQHFRAKDILILQAPSQTILRILSEPNIKIQTEFNPDSRHINLSSYIIGRAVLVSSRSWVGKSLSRTNFKDRHSAHILGIDYRTPPSSGNLSAHPLQNGDTLLLAATRRNWTRLLSSESFVSLDEITPKFFPRRTSLVLAILFLVILTAALNLLPIVVAALTGAVLLFLTRCLRLDETYHQINWQVIFLLAGLIPLGIAYRHTDLLTSLSSFLASSSLSLHPFVLLLLIYLFTTITTEFISNAATVILLTPLALTLALDLGQNPTPFIAMIMFGASTSFATPIGYQTNTMVYTAAKYSFLDFVRVGVPLNLLTALLSALGAYYLYLA